MVTKWSHSAVRPDAGAISRSSSSEKRLSHHRRRAGRHLHGRVLPSAVAAAGEVPRRRCSRVLRALSSNAPPHSPHATSAGASNLVRVAAAVLASQHFTERIGAANVAAAPAYGRDASQPLPSPPLLAPVVLGGGAASPVSSRIRASFRSSAICCSLWAKRGRCCVTTGILLFDLHFVHCDTRDSHDVPGVRLGSRVRGDGANLDQRARRCCMCRRALALNSWCRRRRSCSSKTSLRIMTPIATQAAQTPRKNARWSIVMVEWRTRGGRLPKPAVW